MDVSKAIDKAAGARREQVPATGGLHNNANLNDDGWRKIGDDAATMDAKEPVTAAAAAWQGWGTALKPACEPIIVARRPIVGTVVSNVLKHGTGALNIDATRVAANARPSRVSHSEDTEGKNTYGSNGPGGGSHADGVTDVGRWPANIILVHDERCQLVGTKKVRGDNRPKGGGRRKSGFVAVGSPNGDGEHNGPVYGDAEVESWECHPDCPVRLLDEQTGTLKSGKAAAGGHRYKDGASLRGEGGIYANGKGLKAGLVPGGLAGHLYGDSGGASRFFYCAKVAKKERQAGLNGDTNSHPTLKPIELMRYLVKLVTPPDGVVLDFCAGSGSTGCAAVLEGFRFVGVEQHAEYVKIARARIAHWEQQRVC